MIAFIDDLPVVQYPCGSIRPFERAWLSCALSLAARRAGYSKWWLAGHVTESVASYLRQDFEGGAIAAVQLEKAVRSVLQVIGYSDVAEHFKAGPPPARISLVELARDAGHGYELMFFGLLRERLRDAMDARAERLEIYDAHAGIKLLRRAKNWRRDCSGLLEEVVNIARAEIQSSARPGDIELQIF